MPPGRRLRFDNRILLAPPRARRDVHEGHPGAGPREAAHASDEARKGGEGRERGAASVTRAGAPGGTAATSSAFLLEHVAKLLAVDRSKEIAESVGILTSAKKLFVYGVGRSGLAARAFAMRMVQLGIDCYFIGETITPVVSDGDAVLIVSNTGSTMSAIQVANIARRVGAKVVSVTGHPASKLAHASNVVLLIQANGGSAKRDWRPWGPSSRPRRSSCSTASWPKSWKDSVRRKRTCAAAMRSWCNGRCRMSPFAHPKRGLKYP